MRDKEAYSLERYFNKGVPKDVFSFLEIKGIRPLKSGSKFKVANERGLWTFLYVQKESVTCFDALGQFRCINVSRVKRAVNPSKREKAQTKKTKKTPNTTLPR